jgi:hypothetical protein
MDDLQEQTLCLLPTTNLFRVIPTSDLKSTNFVDRLKLTNFVDRIRINICHSTLELDIYETKDFTVLNWLAGLTEGNLQKEVLTVIALDPKGKILCMLRFCELTLLDHETTFKTTDIKRLMHTINLKFEVMERVKEPPSIGG